MQVYNSNWVCKVFGIDCTIRCMSDLRFPTGRDSEIAPTECKKRNELCDYEDKSCKMVL